MAIKNTITPSNLDVEFDLGVLTPNKIRLKIDGVTLRRNAGVLSARKIYRSVTVTSTLLAIDQVVSVNNLATAITLRMPNAPVIGDVITIKRFNNTSLGAITVNGNTGNIEAQAGTFAITTTLGTTPTTRRAQFVWSGTVWERLIN